MLSARLKRALGERPERIWGWAVLVLLLAFVAVVRFRLRDMPLERDEGEFAYGGQLLLQGILPGYFLYTMKLPGTHAAYAILMALFGQSCTGVHLGFMLVNGATMVLLFLLARMVAGTIAGIVAAATYGWLSLSGDVLGTAAHATHFVVLSAVAGLLLLWRAGGTGRPMQFFWSGGLLSGSVLMKHNGLLFVLAGCAWLVWLAASGKLGQRKAVLKCVALFAFGLTVPFLCLLLVLWRAHTFESYWFWSVTYARAYAKPNPGLVLVWRALMQRLPHVLELPFYASLFGLALLWLRRSSRSAALFATALLVCSLLAVVPGLHLRPHYYVLLIPALALLTGCLVQSTTDLIRASRLRWLAFAPALLFLAGLARGVARESKLFFQMSPVEASRSLYEFQPFPEALVLGEYIRAHCPVDARIAVLGSEPEIYFYSHRRSATGFVYTYPLTEHQPFAPQMRRQMEQELAAAHPEFLVQVRTWTSWQVRPGSAQRVFDLCDALTPPGYQRVGACDFFPGESRVAWRWSPESLKEPPSPASQLVLLRRVSEVSGSSATLNPVPP